MNVEYTAAMEAELDEIEEGKDNLLNTLNQFWKKFEKDLKTRRRRRWRTSRRMEEQTDEVCEKCGSPMVIKWGRYGKFLACSGYPECKNTRQLAGEGGEGGPEVHEDVAKEVCPQGRPAHGPQEGALRALPRLQHAIPSARQRSGSCAARDGKLQVEALAAHRREVSGVRQAT